MKKRLNKILFTVIFLLAISLVSYRYYSFVSETIYRESVAHLTEISHQSTHSVQNFIERNWTVIHLGAEYLEDVSDEKEIKKYISDTKEKIYFTEFYFVSKEGSYYTTNGKTGHLDLENGLSELFIKGEDKFVNSVASGHQELMLFLTPVKGTYEGFSYQAIAFGFNHSDMKNGLKISAFDNTSSRFMIHSDGRVILNHAINSKQNIYNFLAMLRDYSDLSEDEIDKFQNDLKKNALGATLVNLNHTDYYMISEPVGFEDWIMVGLVPVSVVNASMNKLQYSTIFIVIGIMITISLIIFSVVVRNNQRKLKKRIERLSIVMSSLPSCQRM